MSCGHSIASIAGVEAEWYALTQKKAGKGKHDFSNVNKNVNLTLGFDFSRRPAAAFEKNT